MIKRVRERATGAKEVNRDNVTVDPPVRSAAVEHTPESACAALLTIARASSAAELETLRRRFNRAYRTAWKAAWANKRGNPFDGGRGLPGFHGWKDPALGARIQDACNAAYGNPVFMDEGACAMALAIRAKMDKLYRLVSQYVGPYEGQFKPIDTI